MLRMAALAATLLVVLCAAGGVAATAGADEQSETYRKYGQIRNNLIACSLDRTWHHLSAEQRRRCGRLRKLYVLWAEGGESGRYHVHCRSSKKCPTAPFGEPDPRSPIPAGSTPFR